VYDFTSRPESLKMGTWLAHDGPGK
jgi:hypothetical protein